MIKARSSGSWRLTTISVRPLFISLIKLSMIKSTLVWNSSKKSMKCSDPMKSWEASTPTFLNNSDQRSISSSRARDKKRSYNKKPCIWRFRFNNLGSRLKEQNKPSNRGKNSSWSNGNKYLNWLRKRKYWVKKRIIMRKRSEKS